MKSAVNYLSSVTAITALQHRIRDHKLDRQLEPESGTVAPTDFFRKNPGSPGAATSRERIGERAEDRNLPGDGDLQQPG
jgi:hypothetical protein